jgi:2-polyprenyl-6-methoxyphenol hydroxylase-like FAD-dependent oxidoreductase
VSRLSVLVSGAGIAGSALAYWLARFGHSVTVVERSGSLRSSGSPVDVRGPAMPIVERMNIVPRLREASTIVSGWTLLDETGAPSTRVDLGTLWRLRNDIELPRGDLAIILYEASQNSAEFIFGDSVTSLRQDGGGVDVEFEHSRPRRFDIVIGADGLHSRVRQLAFGPETEFVRHAGMYVAGLPLPRSIDPGRDIIMLNAPGKAVGLHPSGNHPLALLIFWHPEMVGFDAWETEQPKIILEETFGTFGWRVPEVLEAVRASGELWFDAVSVVQLANWARDRVALLGDASSCASLFGDGSSLAIAGAYTLAATLKEHPTDHNAALRQYQSIHGKLVGRRLKALPLVAALLVPRTRLGIMIRNRFLALAGPAYLAALRLARRMTSPKPLRS